MKEFKDERAIVRVFGTVNQEAVKKATEKFLKGVETEKKRLEGRKKQWMNS